MVELEFSVAGAMPVLHAAAPAVALALRVSDASGGGAVEAVLLRCQVRIEPLERRYGAEEALRLGELFGDPGAWSRTAGSFSWTQQTLTVPGFSGATTVELALPCGYDFGVAAHKYAHALAAGDLPLALLFSGTIFREDGAGQLRATPIPWSSEVHYALPVAQVMAALEHHYPGRAVLTLRREVFERLYRYRLEHGLGSWEQTLERLLPRAPSKEGRS